MWCLSLFPKLMVKSISQVGQHTLLILRSAPFPASIHSLMHSLVEGRHKSWCSSLVRGDEGLHQWYVCELSKQRDSSWSTISKFVWQFGQISPPTQKAPFIDNIYCKLGRAYWTTVMVWGQASLPHNHDVKGSSPNHWLQAMHSLHEWSICKKDFKDVFLNWITTICFCY